jgi:hypothetical protein
VCKGRAIRVTLFPSRYKECYAEYISATALTSRQSSSPASPDPPATR